LSVGSPPRGVKPRFDPLREFTRFRAPDFVDLVRVPSWVVTLCCCFVFTPRSHLDDAPQFFFLRKNPGLWIFIVSPPRFAVRPHPGFAFNLAPRFLFFFWVRSFGSSPFVQVSSFYSQAPVSALFRFFFFYLVHFFASGLVSAASYTP